MIIPLQKDKNNKPTTYPIKWQHLTTPPFLIHKRKKDKHTLKRGSHKGTFQEGSKNPFVFIFLYIQRSHHKGGLAIFSFFNIHTDPHFSSFLLHSHHTHGEEGRYTSLIIHRRNIRINTSVHVQIKDGSWTERKPYRGRDLSVREKKIKRYRERGVRY